MEKKVRSAAGAILYRWPSEGGIEILAGERRRDPERNKTIVAFSGLIKPADKTVGHAALREANEETGDILFVKITHHVGTYGPHIFPHILSYKDGVLVADISGTELDLPDLFVLSVYAGLVVARSPRDNLEIRNLRWVRPENLADGKTQFAFEQALILVDFWKKYLYDPSFYNPRVLTAIHTSPV